LTGYGTKHGTKPRLALGSEARLPSGRVRLSSPPVLRFGETKKGMSVNFVPVRNGASFRGGLAVQEPLKDAKLRMPMFGTLAFLSKYLNLNGVLKYFA
jgi:hypothetical protein